MQALGLVRISQEENVVEIMIKNISESKTMGLGLENDAVFVIVLAVFIIF